MLARVTSEKRYIIMLLALEVGSRLGRRMADRKWSDLSTIEMLAGKESCLADLTDCRINL